MLSDLPSYQLNSRVASRADATRPATEAVRSTLAVEAIGVAKRYGDREALRHVDLVLRPGQLHGLLGPNGAGKTTLMRILLGLSRADAGTIRVFGAPQPPMVGPIPEHVAGFIEMPGFYPYLSGRRNLALLARLDRQDADAKERINRILGDVGLAGHADQAVSVYSAGMRQRLGVAAALLRAPRLLVLDEPTSSLDPAGARDVRALVRRLVDDGAAVLWSSHDMAEVEEMCEELTVIDHGAMVFAGSLAELRQRAPAASHLLRTSDDAAALSLAIQRPGIAVRPAIGGGLEVAAKTPLLDAYVIALGGAGIAVRHLERRARSLESLFLALTASAESQAALPQASFAS